MRVVLFSDLHAHAFPEFAKIVRPGVTDRLLDCTTVFSTIRKYCAKNRIEFVIFGGDLFQLRGVVRVPAYGLIVEELAAMKEAGITVVVVPGNHDQVDRAGEVDSIRALARAELIHETTQADGRLEVQLGDLHVSGFAYCDSRAIFERRLDASEKEFSSKASRIAVCHLGFKGARVGSHLEYQVKEPLDAKTLLPGRRLDHVFSGHYHGSQRIRGFENAWYIGSPLEHTRSDRDTGDKGFFDYDVEKNTFEQILIRRPRFMRVKASELGDLSAEAVEGNFLDVIRDVDAPEDLAEVVPLLRGFNFVEPKKKQVESDKVAVDPKSPPKDVVKALVEAKGDELEALGMTKQQVYDKCVSLLSEAQEE